MEDYLSTYIFAAIGVVISIVLPILRALLPTIAEPELRSTFTEEVIKPYLVVAAFSLVSAFLIVAGLESDATPEIALLAGYAWDSTLQKMKGETIRKSN